MARSSRQNVGHVPPEWAITQIKTVGRTVAGGRLGLTKSDYVVDGYPAFSASGQDGFVDQHEFEGEAVIVSAIGARCGRSFFANGRWTTLANTQVILTDANKVSAKFLWYVVNDESYWHRSGSAQPFISPKAIQDAWLALPPLPEQKKIAAILSSVDEAIQATQAVIDQTRRVKEGLLQDLLTRGIGHTRFKQTEIGEIPEGWTLKRLEDVSDFITKGSTPTTFGFSWVDDGIPFLRSECVGEEGFTSSGLMHIPVDAQRAMARSTVRSGDILVTITGNVGRVARYPASMPEGNINQHIARVRILPEAQLTEDFVFYSLSARRQRAEFERIVTGQAYPQLSLAQVRDTLVPCPGVAEQRAISRKLLAVDATMAAHAGSRHALIQTKTGLLTDLLTGKVRVTP